MTTERELSSEFLADMHERLTKSCARATNLAGSLNARQLNWKPSADTWSIAQCLEHMLVGADEYAKVLRPAIERGRKRGLDTTGDVEPRHTLMGRMIMRAVEPTAKRKMPAPKIFRPAQSQISEDVVARFVKSHETIAALVADCSGLDFNRVKLGSPIARIIRINAADAFTILAWHAERHLNQAERVQESAGFPA